MHLIRHITVVYIQRKERSREVFERENKTQFVPLLPLPYLPYSLASHLKHHRPPPCPWPAPKTDLGPNPKALPQACQGRVSQMCHKATSESNCGVSAVQHAYGVQGSHSSCSGAAEALLLWAA